MSVHRECTARPAPLGERVPWPRECERNSDLSPVTSIAGRDGSGQDVFEVNIAHAKDQDPVDLPTDSDLDYYGQGDTFLIILAG